MVCSPGFAACSMSPQEGLAMLHYCDRERHSFASPADLQHGGRDLSTVRWSARPPDPTHWRQSQRQQRVPRYGIAAGGCTAPAAAQMACWQTSAPEVAALSAAETDLHAPQRIVERRSVRPGQLWKRQTFTAFHNSGSSPLKFPDAIVSLHEWSRLVRDALPEGLSTERCWDHPDICSIGSLHVASQAKRWLKQSGCVRN